MISSQLQPDNSATIPKSNPRHNAKSKNLPNHPIQFATMEIGQSLATRKDYRARP
jgi:hypothetical protein